MTFKFLRMAREAETVGDDVGGTATGENVLLILTRDQPLPRARRKTCGAGLAH